ncbi:hypothetical protein EOC93_19980 [Mesorhizobium sp. M6A.T.Ce.TU.002.03.1.1]|uniref:hypothetical protein n=1 Tax=Mesorhizobium sp. M6A.T.Ce.TU.002.03.1.1 TaxID=2496782 RepID=UPI000FCC0E76|nr:hypothetical protein [Mesorhizobium sp. M6A.T.Ce.TU.002.03.1.1]RUU41492.1 hypothetical protein EOC93_19980 [Mesorhizobium sp. M6A.T.Ce.TU.002.03.1.1]
MDHSTATLFAFPGSRLRLIQARDSQAAEDEPRSPVPVQLDAGRSRLPPRDESFYWAWQYWSQ